MKNETKQAVAVSAIEALKAANDHVDETARKLSAEQERNSEGFAGEYRRKKAEIEHLEAKAAHQAARTRAQAELDSRDAEAGTVESPSTLLAKMRERLEARSELANAIERLESDLHSELLEASRALAKERSDLGLPLPAVHALISKVQLPQWPPVSAMSKAYLPTAFAELVKLLEGAAAGAPVTSNYPEQIRQERGKLRAIEVAMAREAAELEKEKIERDHAKAEEAREQESARVSGESNRKQREAQQAAERASEDALLARFGRGFGGAA